MTYKYKLTDETRVICGITIYRIEALRDIPEICVKAGDKGGFIEKEENLSQGGNAWVFGNARVTDNARVYGNAQVYGDACVYGNARVDDNAWVSGNAWVTDNACVYGDAHVSGNACVYDNERASRTPIMLTGLAYPVIITDIHMKCGCKCHTHAEWAEFDERTILEMDGKPALTFWRAHKAMLMALIYSHTKPVKDK